MKVSNYIWDKQNLYVTLKLIQFDFIWDRTSLLKSASCNKNKNTALCSVHFHDSCFNKLFHINSDAKIENPSQSNIQTHLRNSPLFVLWMMENLYIDRHCIVCSVLSVTLTELFNCFNSFLHSRLLPSNCFFLHKNWQVSAPKNYFLFQFPVSDLRSVRANH